MGERYKAIVFLNSNETVQELSQLLFQKKIRCQCCHTGQKQGERSKALNDFRSGYVPVRPATDFVSRGMDFKDITQVINYEFPRSIVDYGHRIGRTGQAGGQSLS